MFLIKNNFTIVLALIFSSLPAACNEQQIDVLIPCTSKDKRTLDLCIEGIKKHGKNINRVIVVSAQKITDNAEWFDEKEYPFSKDDIALHIFKDEEKAKNYLKQKRNRIGWVFQQLLKLYGPFVIPDIANNVLLLDADTIFLRPVNFIDEDGTALYNPAGEYHPPYFAHGKRLIPGFKKIYNDYSGIAHHMLLQKNILTDLFELVEKHHDKAFWEAFCDCIDQSKLYGSCVSEYELYFNFIFGNEYNVKIRKLRWSNIRFSLFKNKKKQEYDYLSCHTYL